MRYAMILKNRVIGILDNQTAEPKWPPDSFGNDVTAVICDENTKVGMLFNKNTGAFYKYAPKKQVTKTDKIFAIVSKSKEEIENAAIDAYTEELIEGGLL